jgi:bifunctional DNA-binding transcriptional regulator/antitoxin component of YhaV-PrlF toxin-antitoxin module
VAAKKYKFKAKIEPAGMGGSFVLFPYDTEKEFGTKGKVPVKATFDGIAYTGSLIKYGYPQHSLHVPKAIREEAGKGPGDVLDVVVWKDDEKRVLEVPVALAQMMKKEGLLAFFESLSYTHRKEYCRWISEAKKEDTRAKRLDKAVVMMKAKVKTPG